MKLIKPYTKILTAIDGKEILKIIEKVARTCYKSEDKITNESAEQMIKNLLAKKHEAMLEFFDIIVKFICDRGVSHEIVRHRIASYAQESTRYCNYSKDKFNNQLTFIIPCWSDHIYDGEWRSKSEQSDFTPAENTWYKAMIMSETYYNELINLGWQPQQARTVLPNSLKTEINVKMNLREWRHFFTLRTSIVAHPQMRELTIPLLKEFKLKIPVLFDDINK